MKKVKVFLLRRWYMVGGAALVLAAAIFYVVSYPASVSTAAHARASSAEFSMGTFSSIHLNTSSCSTEFTSIQSSSSPAA